MGHPTRREVAVVGMTIHDVLADALAMAKDDHESVIELTRELVTIPSRGGVDPYEPVIDRISGWLAQRGLPGTVLRDTTGATVGLTCEVRGSRPGPRWVLDACLDTAPFGDEDAWTHPPTSAVTADGWLWGRGSSDSKVGAAIFCHIAARLAAITDQWRGTLVLLFDVDEHTGGFGGAKRYFEGADAPNDVAGVMIGYPGMDKLVVGGAACTEPRCTSTGSLPIRAAARALPTRSRRQHTWYGCCRRRSCPTAAAPTSRWPANSR